jgi:hypothetical protein
MVSSKLLLAVCVCLAIANICSADLYMHQPRGSNNRLNERSANRNNGNRLFDSQNNNRGGYNKGDNTVGAFANYNQQYHMTHFMSDESGDHKSIMHVEWTNQHGCGGNEHGDPAQLNCAIILQYMCLPEMVERATGTTILAVEEPRSDCNNECHWPVPGNLECEAQEPFCPPMDIRTQACCNAAGGKWKPARIYDQFNCLSNGGGTWGSGWNAGWGGWAGAGLPSSQDWPRLRDGLNTNRQDFTTPKNAAQTTGAGRFARYNKDVDPNRGLHENWEHYDECYRRERNRGLFTADQNLANNDLGYSSAVFTRQNPNNNRRGYECPEERDYYPYWHPSPWRDIAVMTDRLDQCEFFRQESQNVKAKGVCRNTANCNNCIKYNQASVCVSNNGRWVDFPAHGIPPPDCIQAPWSRPNHHGNGRHGQMNSYNWTIPYMGLPDGAMGVSNQTFRCVVRLRYNMSTDDYDYSRVNASFNQNNGQGIASPVRQNPNVNIGAANQALRLAINTAQFGRTFQDRSHTFRLMTRPKFASPAAMASSAMANRPRNQGQLPNFFDNCGTLWNLNVRGKRGNIVQTYPAVEYDFSPNDLTITDGDCVHVQWTGSNTHNNGNPAGDGQAGDAGEGTGGTDRHNWVQLESANFASSFPLPWENNTLFTFLKDAYSPLASQNSPSQERAISRDIRCGGGWNTAKLNWALRMASAGYYNSFECPNDHLSVTARPVQLNNLLNNAFPSYEGGIFQFRYGTYSYMCTRNHNFTNRDQKGVLRVVRPPTTPTP